MPTDTMLKNIALKTAVAAAALPVLPAARAALAAQALAQSYMAEGLHLGLPAERLETILKEEIDNVQRRPDLKFDDAISAARKRILWNESGT